MFLSWRFGFGVLVALAGFGLGVLVGRALFVREVSGISLWAALSPDWLIRWGREADSKANEERARRRVEMDMET